MKLEKAKELQSAFKSNLNDISRGKYKTKEQKNALENIKLLYKSRETVIEIFNDYFSIVFEAKYKTFMEKGFKVSHVAKVLTIQTSKY